MSHITLVQTTLPDRAAAEQLAAAMVEARLAACANILGDCASIYRWQGVVERAEEVAVQFKTRPELAEQLANAISASHPYDLPVIEHWQAQVTEEVAAWVAAHTP